MPKPTNEELLTRAAATAGTAARRRALLNKPLDPIQILWDLAKSCTRAEDDAFWILTSASAYLNPDYNFHDGEGSTAAAFYWDRLFPCWETTPRWKA